MPIQGATPAECFAVFEEYVRGLIAQVLTTVHPVTIIQMGSDRAALAFRQVAGPGQRPLSIPIPLKTRYGPMRFYMWQILGAVPLESGGHRLTTLKYRYRLEATVEGKNQDLVRWEYEPESANVHPRYHVQIGLKITVAEGRQLNLAKAHLATGRVLLEEVLRFVIADLGFEPPCGDRWNDVLREGERRFHEEFGPHNYRTNT